MKSMLKEWAKVSLALVFGSLIFGCVMAVGSGLQDGFRIGTSYLIGMSSLILLIGSMGQNQLGSSLGVSFGQTRAAMANRVLATRLIVSAA